MCYNVKSKLLFCLQTTDLSVFETNIRFVGGLLTCFALTGDVIFRDKAELVARKLLPAFQTQTGIPHSLINVKTGVKHVTLLIKDPFMCIMKFFLIKFKLITHREVWSVLVFRD
jgi:mannosyl-oligosaccharide alpha-1,2-mannosidase